ncbi:hypothetical protein [Aquamicrobium sp.]|uniref:hypothetical protein n=1 Tax=Aquamicrobium sp. TaxID=1872579 RepID=UPI00258F8EB1|nr:hypothetical protein [Aquamicrobium sp.]MCK9552330.1 hypothetical protein [Aquamicrobium sp.]
MFEIIFPDNNVEGSLIDQYRKENGLMDYIQCYVFNNTVTVIKKQYLLDNLKDNPLLEAVVKDVNVRQNAMKSYTTDKEKEIANEDFIEWYWDSVIPLLESIGLKQETEGHRYYIALFDAVIMIALNEINDLMYL